MTKREILLGFADKVHRPVVLDTIYVTMITQRNSSSILYQAASTNGFNYHNWPHVGNAKLVESEEYNIHDHPERTTYRSEEMAGQSEHLLNLIKDLERENRGKFDYDNFIDRTIELKYSLDRIVKKVDEEAVTHWFEHGM